MGKKALVRTYLLAVVWCAIAMTVLISSTYAWFTLQAVATITPMRGTIGTADGTLLISNRPDGDFDVSCELTPDLGFVAMKPVTTDDLQDFYRLDFYDAVHRNYVYTGAAEQMPTDVLHGYLYLKSEDSGFDIYFEPDSLKVTAPDQILAALRMGLVITGREGAETLIFKLDSFATGGNLQVVQDAEHFGNVVSSLTADGAAQYGPDPAAEPGDYRATLVSDQAGYLPGQKKLYHIRQEEIITVEYFFYLEGCDIHCVKDLQGKELEVQFGFAGVPIKTESGSEGTSLE